MVIFLVDDQAMIRTVGAMILQRDGHEVLLGEDGEHALEVYRANRDRVDLVILDLTMPRLSGRETLVKLREINPHVRVILSSGYSTDTIPEGDACAGFIGKPYRPEELTAVIERAMAAR